MERHRLALLLEEKGRVFGRKGDRINVVGLLVRVTQVQLDIIGVLLPRRGARRPSQRLWDKERDDS